MIVVQEQKRTVGNVIGGVVCFGKFESCLLLASTVIFLKVALCVSIVVGIKRFLM